MPSISLTRATLLAAAALTLVACGSDPEAVVDSEVPNPPMATTAPSDPAAAPTPANVSGLTSQAVALPYVPPITLPNLSELNDLGGVISESLGGYAGNGVEVVGATCAPAGDENTSFLDAGPDGAQRLSENAGGQAVDITVNADGSGTYRSAGTAQIDVDVEADGSGRYFRSAKGESIELTVASDGSGQYEESAESVIDLTLDGTGAGTYAQTDPGADGGILEVTVRDDGSGTYSRSLPGGIVTHDASADGSFSWSQSGGDPDVVRSLEVAADGSGSYSDSSQDLTITVAPSGEGVYSVAGQDTAFSTEEGILDPGLVTVEGTPEYIAATRFPALETLPPLEPPCETVIRFDAAVLFAFDSDELLPRAGAILDDVAPAVIDAARPLEVLGHTDSKGEEAYNLDLSQRRADAVVTALKARGVTVAMSAEGRGEAEPIAANETADGADNPAGRRSNRRVEIVIRP